MKCVLQSTTVSYHSVPFNWPKPSIWHHFLFSLTINNAVIISKVFVAHSEEIQVAQLANKGCDRICKVQHLYQHYTVTVSVIWLSCIIIITDWLIFSQPTAGYSHSCCGDVGVCLMSSSVSVIFVYFWMQTRPTWKKKHQIYYMLIHFAGFMWKQYQT